MSTTRLLLAAGLVAAVSTPAAAERAPDRVSRAPVSTLPEGAVGAIDLEHPRGIYIPVPEELRGDDTPTSSVLAKAPTIIYMNRDGGVFQPGINDSSLNLSSIVRGTADVPAWNVSQAGWDQVMSCVEDMFSEYNVVITDEDPGDMPHVESVVAGYPQHIGMPQGVGGVSPFTCGSIDTSIVFTFAEIYGNNYQEVCHTVAQEVSHSFGLDHEYLCQDPMTYLRGCGPKTFQDTAAQCGEFEPRQCNCGGSTQNSVQMLFDRLGPADLAPPTLNVTEPSDGASVDAGFAVVTEVTDDRGIDRVDFYVDGEWAGVAAAEPYELDTAADLPSGVHVVDVIVTDGVHDVSESIQVLVHGDDLPSSCDGDSDCPAGFECGDGECVAEATTFPAGELGAFCATDDHCASGLCMSDGRSMRCSQLCGDGQEQQSCPDGLSCVAAGEDSVCWPEKSDTGVCSLAGGGAGAAGALPVLFALLLAGRRRRDD